MLNALTGFFRGLWGALRRSGNLLYTAVAWPFRARHSEAGKRAYIFRGSVALIVLVLIAAYGQFLWRTQVWYGFDPAFAKAFGFADRKVAAGQQIADKPGTCQNSAIVTTVADLTDSNVNQNVWVSSTLLYKLGLFGMSWDDTPFFDNKASFQRGINQVARRVGIVLADDLGRVRGTSGINTDLQDARGNIQFNEGTWYFGSNPFGFKTPTPSYYRAAITSWRGFNSDLETCKAVFDARADNLVKLLDGLASDLGNTSDILRRRSEEHNGGWFDTRADDRFWFAYGQLYGQYALFQAAKADFIDVVRERNLTAIWAELEKQFEAALKVQPMIVSNGSEDGLFMPNHLSTMGFYTLRVRANMVELRAVLQR
ncbi:MULTISPECIES: DUF2333 family protein [Rhizobium/Agrobacterium group]|uniref:DUF2333 family protein n=2 Tax=Rhizobium/Agrobacterium group TaxID=227290 RepID=B9JZN8_ALLAM|nr:MULTISPECIES: DUF2333 family protein [Rhizobium/Agrobacterium group]ACM37348.1 conserved hypothetical protein [Allorhizobium ampelinum S4]MUO30137.1 DUF2333 family protein [Agrobacterium vitis]MUO45527.1 DUF2333 family protein [Agrobacterium vitis]MUP11898.1 DUF2333 family protein [Agrobacterium vitis]